MDNYSLRLVRATQHYATITDHSSLKPTGNFTIEAWIRLIPGISYQTIFSSWSQNTNTAGILLFVDSSNKLRLWIGSNNNGGTANSDTTSSASVANTRWMHVAATYDGSNVRLYVNGKLDTTQANTSNPVYAGTNYIRLGAQVNSGSLITTSIPDGFINDVRVWNTARSTANIRDNFYNELVGNETNLQGYWPLNNSANDLTSNANNATLVNSPQYKGDVPQIAGVDLEAADFDAFIINDSASLDITGDISIECLISPESLPSSGNVSILWSKWFLSFNPKAYLLQIYNNSGTYKLSWWTANSGGTEVEQQITIPNLVVGEWTHLAMTYKASTGTMKLYKNGVYINSATGGNTDIGTNVMNAIIGQRDFGDFDSYDGKIAEYRIWNTERSAANISDNFLKVLNGSESGLVAYWRWNKTLNDLTSNANHSTLYHNPTYIADNPFYYKNIQAMDFEASSSQYLYRNDASGVALTGNCTIELWAKFESLPTSGNRMALCSKWQPGQSAYYFFVENNAGTYELHLATADGVSVDNVIKTISVSTGNWYHFAVKFTAASSLYEMFLNGTSLGTYTGARTSIQTCTATFQIGAGDAGNYFDGKIDEVRVWNIVRANADIAADMSRELSGIEVGLLGYWRLNGTVGGFGDIEDCTVNSADLAMSGSPVYTDDIPFLTSLIDRTNTTETITIVDTVTPIKVKLKAVNETATIVDTVRKTVGRILTETVGLNATFSSGVPFSASAIGVYRSSNTDSDGGTITATPVVSNVVDNLFPEVTQNQAEFGLTTYRKIFIKNDHTSSTWTQVKVFLGSVDDYTADTYAVGIGTSSDTDGSAISYTTPVTRESGLSISDLAPGQSAAIWVRRVVSPGAELYKKLNDFIIYFGGV